MTNEHLMNDLVNENKISSLRHPLVTIDTYIRMIQWSIDTFNNAFSISIPIVFMKKILGHSYSCTDIRGRHVEVKLEVRGWSSSITGYRNFRVVFTRVGGDR